MFRIPFDLFSDDGIVDIGFAEELPGGLILAQAILALHGTAAIKNIIRLLDLDGCRQQRKEFLRSEIIRKGHELQDTVSCSTGLGTIQFEYP